MRKTPTAGPKRKPPEDQPLLLTLSHTNSSFLRRVVEKRREVFAVLGLKIIQERGQTRLLFDPSKHTSSQPEETLSERRAEAIQRVKSWAEERFADLGLKIVQERGQTRLLFDPSESSNLPQTGETLSQRDKVLQRVKSWADLVGIEVKVGTPQE